MEGFPLGGDPEDLMRSLREVAEQQAGTGQEAQRGQFSTLTLDTEGKLATLDVLGEEVTDPEEARAIAGAYREAIDAFARGRLDSNISVKPTALGLNLSYELCRENLLEVVRHAGERGNFVRIDME